MPGSIQHSKHKKMEGSVLPAVCRLAVLTASAPAVFLTASVYSLNQTPACPYTTGKAIVIRVANS